MSQTVLILGASGKIGTHASEAFWNAGWTVRSYQRGTDMATAAMGCDVIVNGLNPPGYKNWRETIPAITADVIAAAKASGATVIIPGNVYNFGDTPGTWDETTPQKPVSVKGRIRVDMEQSYKDAGVPTIILRAGNFLDPNRDGDMFSLAMTPALSKGKMTRMGDMDVMQTYAYLPDWARAAVSLAEMRADLPRFADIPFPGHAFSTRSLHSLLEEITGRSLKVTAFPWWLMTLAAPVWPLARELREMRYLNETSHQLGRTLFDRLLPEFHATPMAEAIAECLPADVHPNDTVWTSGKAVAAE